MDSASIQSDEDSAGIQSDEDSAGIQSDEDSAGIQSDEDSAGIQSDEDSMGVGSVNTNGRTTIGRGLGIVSVAFGLDCPLPEAARRAAALDFDHLDIAVDRLADGADEPLAIAVGDCNGPVPTTGCTCRLPRACTWDECVTLLRREPDLRVEPGPRSVLDSAAAIRAMCQEVPGLRITLDTGWAVFCGYDPLEVADLAGHVQLRQARPGQAQLHPDEKGEVDFAAVVDGFAALDYDGLFSVEYFDLPDMGLALDDPLGHCVALAERVRPMLAG